MNNTVGVLDKEFHPVANIFPLLQGEEYEKLKTDIAQNGLIEPIWLHPDGRIVDGRNRWRACTETNTNARFETWNEARHGPLVSFVVSLNIRRRHLDSSQRAAVAVAALPMLEDEARERQLASLPKEGLKGFQSSVSQKIDTHSENGRATEQAAEIFHTNRQYVSDAKNLNRESLELFEQVKNGKLSIPQAKQKLAREIVPEPTQTPPLPPNKYRCLVIDPPWPVKKIEREERPNQGIELDYPTMTLEQIEALPILDLADESGCHLYLWVTQKYLPVGLKLVEKWGFSYQCLMTWKKNVGITPYSWMYDTEHVIFARLGNLPLQQLGLRLSFEAAVNGHSVKPDVFFQDRVRLASPEPRLEMFARKQREGFEVWGNEV